LEGFVEHLDAWVQREAPPEDLLLLVIPWIMTRYDDPYRGVQREPDFDNLWFGRVPDTDDGSGAVVTCSYWIDELDRTVRCNSIARLNWPV
jgi:hypothetical protein